MRSFRWEKLGLIFNPRTRSGIIHPKLLSHASNPVAVKMTGNLYRIFYSGRDASNRSSVGALDFDFDRLAIVTNFTEPLFTHGPPESFYADGVSLGDCYAVDNHTYLLFMGWQSPLGHHWRGDIGRLILQNDFSLSLSENQPLLPISTTDPISFSYPCVLRNEAGGYDMWYGSTLDWTSANGEMIHVIHHAESQDGKIWQCRGLSIPFEIGVAQAFSRPAVRSSPPGGKQMWFSFRGGRGDKYRIGYAHCDSSGIWCRENEKSGIDVSAKGWDSEMIEYPFLIDHKKNTFMLYNGNGYGATGFGIAILREV